MNGEFKLNLKSYDSAIIKTMFEDAYGDLLKRAYEMSEFAAGDALDISRFYAGYHTDDSLFLVYSKESSILRVYVETDEQTNVEVMKEAINRYFVQVVKELKDRELKWDSPAATIKLENCKFEGVVKTRKAALADVWEKQKEKLLIAPIASVLASYLAVYENITNKEELTKDLKKTVTLTLESYIGTILLVLAILLISRYKKKFTFSI